MRSPSLLTSAKARLRPRYVAAVVAAVTLLAVVRVTLGEVPVRTEALHWVLASVLALALVALAPVPWQWTGDARKRAPALRGLAQALPWNLAWLLLLMLATAPFRPLRAPGLGGHPLAAHVARTLAGRPLARRAFGPVAVLMPLALLVGGLVALFQASEEGRREALEGRGALERMAREAQEQALKAQLDPHVLYNALGGITELVREDPARAEEALLSLAELYRQLTAFGRRSDVAVAEERALAADYLKVEQVRLGPRLRVEWDWPADLDGLRIPPLLVQPLVENAVKHGIAPLKEGGRLRISAAAEGAGIRVRVADDGAPLDPARAAGTGLANLAQRLALLGGGSRFDLRAEGPWKVAELVILPGGRP